MRFSRRAWGLNRFIDGEDRLETHMAHDVKFMVLNADEAFGLELRSMLLKLDGAKIVAEVDEPALLTQAVAQFPVDILVIHLDPHPESLLPVMAEVAAARPTLPIFTLSESTEGSLILKVMRLGVKEFLPKPLDAHALIEAIGRIELQRGEVASHGRLFTVIGSAGGVGSTMLATNLGVELAALASRDVTVVDLDYRFGQAATLLDMEPDYTLADLCGGADHLETSIITRALCKHPSGLNVLSRPNHFAEADTMTAASCVGVLTSLLNMNEYVVSDGPTRFDINAKSILALSDVNLLVVQLLVPCVRSAMRILDNMRNHGYNLDRTKLICNRVGRDAGHLTPGHVAETLGLEVFATIPDDWTTVSGAINLGEPLASHSPKNKVRTAVQEIAARLHRGDEGTEGKAGSKKEKGLIGRIFAQS